MYNIKYESYRKEFCHRGTKAAEFECVFPKIEEKKKISEFSKRLADVFAIWAEGNCIGKLEECKALSFKERISYPCEKKYLKSEVIKADGQEIHIRIKTEKGEFMLIWNAEYEYLVKNPYKNYAIERK